MESEEFGPKPPPDQAGMGGGLPYLDERSTSRMVNQENHYSCVAACARQLLRDAGADFTETALSLRIGLVSGIGIDITLAAEVLSELHPTSVYIGGLRDPDQAHNPFPSDPWVARVKTLSSRVHAVIVDGVRDDIVSIRDPWGLMGPGSGNGTAATIRLDDFLDHWRRGLAESSF